jgi:hypothetical protein
MIVDIDDEFRVRGTREIEKNVLYIESTLTI